MSEARRERMLGELQAAMLRSHERRRARRSIAALLIVVGFAVSLPFLAKPAGRPHASLDIAAAVPTGDIRIVAITTDDLLDSFARVNLAAAVFCEPTGGCELLLLDSSLDRASIIR